ncbi:DUF4129 domain-containing protein [Cellulomonas citrea]|uniref:DUF4129 domain-containing protein n=1 Tax=Cellulomonas citrea TaxID=1909423 RepID=UPI001F2DC7A3|nr:DUF4129 domain-containing protein [Cellulomonas citrea]
MIAVGPLRLDVPVDPDASTARLWAQRELADPIYHQGPSLLTRFLRWVGEQLDALSRVSISSHAGLLAIIAVLVALVVVVLVVSGPVRRRRREAAAVAQGVLVDDTRTAEQLRADARAAAAHEVWEVAVADWFRAVVRGLEERTVLDERPGRTADEAARSAAHRLPDLAAALDEGARLFDDVVYGHRRADRADEAAMRALDAAVQAAHPVWPSPVAA